MNGNLFQVHKSLIGADVDYFSAEEGSESLVNAIRARDESAVSTYVESTPNCGVVLVAAILFASHETPYSYFIPSSMLELIKNNNSPGSVIGTIMSFWRERPSTGTVLVMKYVDLGIITLEDVVSWLLEQDSLMHKSWVWEIIQTCFEKVDSLGSKEEKTDGRSNTGNTANDDSADAKISNDMVSDHQSGEEVMQIDFSSGEANGTQVNIERRKLLSKIISDVATCYERQQDEWDHYWVKEWLAMIIRKFKSDVAEMEGTTNWVSEMLAEAKEYQKRLV